MASVISIIYDRDIYNTINIYDYSVYTALN